MKKVVISLLVFAFAMTSVFAQGDKDLKSAIKSLRTYKYDPEKNASELVEAIKSIKSAGNDEAVHADVAFWLTKGEIFLKTATNAFYVLKYPDAPFTSFEAYTTAIGKSEKKGDKTTALEGVQALFNPLNELSVAAVEKKDYPAAYKALNHQLEIKRLLNENGMTGILDDEEQLNNIRFYTAYTAMLSENTDQAKKMFAELLETSVADSEPALYVNLYRLYLDEDADKALSYLSMGRKKFADNQSLLLNETQHFLDRGLLAEAEARLQEAIAQDPENVLLYTSLGKVYDDLYQKGEMADETLFTKAEGYYNKAIELDPKHLGAVYNLGAMYFNKTTPMRKEMNDLPLNESKKYDALKKKVEALFAKALPYFETAYEMDAKDMNTLIALKEIMAAMDNLEASNKYKAELETLKAGN